MPPTLSCIRLSTLLDARFFHSSLPAAGAIALHACGVCHRNQAILFAARSPEPRHTLATLWRAYRPSSRVLSERRMIVRPTGSRFRAFPDPAEEPGGSSGWDSPFLAAIHFIYPASVTSLRPLPHSHALARLLAWSTLPFPDLELTHQAIATAHVIVTRVPCTDLEFHPGRHVLDMVAPATD